MSVALETRNLTKAFGGFTANSDVSLTLQVGERHALIGPNGAGKTTFINLLTGVLAPTSGRVLLRGEDVTDLALQARVKRGMARTFQINQLFGELTPLESVALALAQGAGVGGRWLAPIHADRALVDEAAALLATMRLGDVMTLPVQRLAYGKQRLLEVTLALACKPKVLLLDEPAAGVPEEERHEILDSVAALPSDVTVLLIEHDMELVFAFVSRITVLVQGMMFAQGGVDDIARDPRVKAVYLGEDGAGAHG